MQRWKRWGLGLVVGLAVFPSLAGAVAVGTITKSVSASANTSGLTAEVRCPVQELSQVSVGVTAGGAATVFFQVSADGQVWFNHTTLLNAASGTATFDGTVVFPYLRVTSSTTGVALDFALACK